MSITGSYVTSRHRRILPRPRVGARRTSSRRNRFELEYLTGHSIATLAEAGVTAAALRALGPGIVLVTSIEIEGDRIAMLVAGPDGVWVVETPRLPVVLKRLRRTSPRRCFSGGCCMANASPTRSP